jgi:CRISPR-associated protein Cas1
MIGRIVEIASEGCHLARHRGFLTVARNGEEVGRTPLDDIGAVVCTA